MPATRRPRRTSLAAAAALSLALAATLSGCGIGFDAGTTLQRASGNGSNADLGSLQLRGITLVKADASTDATLIGTIVNRGTEDDALTAVNVVDPKASSTIAGAAVVGGALPLKTFSSTRIGFNADDHVAVTGLQAAPTQYVDVELVFQKAGTISMQVMAVPPTGYYQDVPSATG